MLLIYHKGHESVYIVTEAYHPLTNYLPSSRAPFNISMLRNKKNRSIFWSGLSVPCPEYWSNRLFCSLISLQLETSRALHFPGIEELFLQTEMISSLLLRLTAVDSAKHESGKGYRDLYYKVAESSIFNSAARRVYARRTILEMNSPLAYTRIKIRHALYLKSLSL